MVTAFGTRRWGVRCAVAAAACLLVASPAWGTLISPSGSQVFIANAIASGTFNVNSANSFTITGMVSTEPRDGYFLTLDPFEMFPDAPFSVDDPLSLQFGNSVFGTFRSTTIRQTTDAVGNHSRSFKFDGWFEKGTGGADLNPNPAFATFTLSLNQANGAGAIQANGVLAFGIQPVPEPATVALLAMAIGTAAAVRARHRKA